MKQTRRAFLKFVSQGIIAAGYVATFGLPRGGHGMPAPRPVAAPQSSYYLAEYIGGTDSARALGDRMLFRQPLVPKGWRLVQPEAIKATPEQRRAHLDKLRGEAMRKAIPEPVEVLRGSSIVELEVLHS